MPKKMLIDATQPEETRVVVVDGQQLVDFDFETSTKKQLKGNIYLAKVTRVEPSLQAAFVDYGGNRHGFLAFSEIHPDYYQIPQADRALLDQLEQEVAERAVVEQEASSDDQPNGAATDIDDDVADVADLARRRARILRSYKIQEVIKRRQILLVQVVKEERGNKGAAMTTYLSLAGRYCVLMPNTPRGGGISRKIANPTDRRRLKSITQELSVPQGMGLIVRTAGQERSKTEIKRDYDYLLRLWSEIRESTLQSIAPTLIYEEGDLIKRAMRDLYTRDIDEVFVEGEEGYRSAKRLMQMLTPSRARRVKQFKDVLPIFVTHDVEHQLDQMHSPTVQLSSGGSIVIHTTEALTAIDVNSGRATRERHIDETAVKTNLEASDEIARQLRLRDLAGLVVVDFIDMSENRHQRQVERRFREALKADRARIQLGKISMFGLMELSRQRLRPSLQELSSQICPTCSGAGVVRSTESCALHALRLVQDKGIEGIAASLRLILPEEVALYILNQKRDSLHHLEERYSLKVMISIDREMLPADHQLDVLEKREVEEEAEAEETETETASKKSRSRRSQAQGEEAQATEAEATQEASSDETEDGGGRKRRRRRRRRRSRSDEATEATSSSASSEQQDPAVVEVDQTAIAAVAVAADQAVTEAVAKDASDELPHAPTDGSDQDAASADNEEREPQFEDRSQAETSFESKPASEEIEVPTALAEADIASDDGTNTVTSEPMDHERLDDSALAGSPPIDQEPLPETIESADGSNGAPAQPNGTDETEEEEPDHSTGVQPPPDEEPKSERQGWWSRWVR